MKNYDRRWKLYFILAFRDPKRCRAVQDKLIRDYKNNKDKKIVRN